jgi:hypothetical protein
MSTLRLLAGAILLLSACKIHKPPLSIKVEKVSFSNSGPPISTNIEYPQISSGLTPEIAARINTAIRAKILAPLQDGKPTESARDLAAQFADEYRLLQAHAPDYNLPWFVTRRASLVTVTPSILSFECDNESFTGGAHPNTIFTYLNFDPASGERLSLSDILNPEAEGQLARIAEKRFREMKKLAPGADLNSSGYQFQDDRFVLAKNFYPSRAGLVFYYNSYEIAPYVMGPTVLTLPYAGIKSLILPGVELPGK